MAPSHTIKSWNEDDESLLSFYHLNLCHPEREGPTFGSDMEVNQLRDAHMDTLPGTRGEEESKEGGNDSESSTSPTLLNLAWSFNF